MIIVFRLNEKIKPINKLSKKYIQNIDDYKTFFLTNENKWFKSDDLIMFWGVNSSSNIRQIINYLRIEYHLTIISSHNGYKFSTDKKEIKEYIKRLNYRALTQLSAAKSIS